jgi:hypothetical protein
LGICQEHQLQCPTIEAWVTRYVSGALTLGSPSRESELARENEKLKAKIGELTMTVDLLKKMEAWKRQQNAVTSSIITAKNLAQFAKPAKPPASPESGHATSRKTLQLKGCSPHPSNQLVFSSVAL